MPVWRLRAERTIAQLVSPTTPDSIAGIRILVCAVLLASTVWEDLASSALLPLSMRHPMGLLEFLYVVPGFSTFVRSPAALAALDWFTAVVLGLGLVGWRTRVTLPLGVVCYFLLGGILRQYAWFYHTGLIPLYLLAALSFTPCADAWSIDRLRRIARGRSVPALRHPTWLYGASRYLCWIVLALPYVMAGLSKIRNGGLIWWHPTAMRGILYTDSLSPMQFDFGYSLLLSSAPDAVFAFMGILTIVTELAYGSVLFSMRARQVLPLVTLLMHVGILLMQNVLFFDLILLQLMFVDVRPCLAAIQRWVPRVWRPIETVTLSGHASPSVGGAFSGRREMQVAAVACGLAILMVTCWALRIERYPLTGMQMYSRPSLEGVVTYHRVLAHRASGETTRPPFEETVPAIATIDSRYRLVLYAAFRDAPTSRWDRRSADVCREFFETVAALYNPTVSSEEQITRFEVQQWQWDFRLHPDDPAHGQVVDRLVFDDL